MLALRPLQRYFEFAGRSGRAEYWQYTGLVVVAVIVAGMVDYGINPYGRPNLGILVLLGTLIPNYAAAFRRLHDRGLSGWLIGGIWVLNGIYFSVNNFAVALEGSLLSAPFTLIKAAAVLLTLALAAFLLWQMCLPGEPGSNIYGAPDEASASAPPLSSYVDRFTTAASSIRPTASAVPPDDTDPLAQIERLAKLHAAGALSDEEFADRKAALLKRV